MNKLFTKIAWLSIGLAMAIGVGVAVGNNRNVARVDAAGDTTISWTATSGALGKAISKQGGTATGSITLAPTSGSSYTMSYTRTLVALASNKSDYVSWQGSTWIQLGSGNASQSVVFSASSIPGTIKSVSIQAATAGTHTYTIDVGGTKYANALSLTTYSGTASATNPSPEDTTKTATGSSSGALTITLTAGTRKALVIRSISVTYNNDAPAKSLSSIALSGSYPTTFTQGDAFSHTGMTVTATYSDASTADVSSSATFSGYNMSTTGNQTVTVSYTEGGTTKKTTYSITVNAPKTPASVSSTGQTTTFEAGDKFAYGGTLTATYTDSTSAGVTPTSFKIGNAGIDPTSAGTAIVPGTTALSSDDHNGKTVYVLYTENNTTVYTSYVITVNKISKITLDPTVTSSFPYQGITLTVTDGTLTNGTDYRVYKNQTMTITSTVGDMAKIEFTYSSASYDGGGWSSAYTPNDDTWTSPTANGEQARITKIIVTLASTDPLVELDISSATSVSMLKGDSDTSVKVLVKNITTKTWSYTFDEDEEEGIATSSYINVSAGSAVNNVHTLTITTKAIGSTVLHISVSGTACAASIPVTVAAKPASMTIVYGEIHEGELEIITGEHKQVSFSGLDTDGNPYSIAAADVTPSATSGASYVTLSGSRITGASEGTAVVRYTLNALTSVYAEITVNVVDDYIESVGEPTFATGLTDTQGQSPTVSVFTSRPGTMHSGSSTTVPFENYKFSYTENYAAAEYGSVFSYDFSHGTTVDSTHKLQTIYVFCDIDEAAHGSYTITVEQANDPLTDITFTNVVNNEVDVTRGSTFQLEWAYTPTNPTDGKEVVFVIDDNSDGIDITVSELGLISIGASSNLGTALVLIQSAHDDTIKDYVYVSAVLGTMKYTVREDVSWTKVTDDSTLSAGDVIMVASESKGKVLGEFSGTNKYANEGTAKFSDGSASDVTGALEFTLETGSESGTWKLKNNTKYLYGTSSKTTLCLSDTSADVTISISSGNATIDFGSSCRILHNVGSTRFSNYTSDTSVSMLLPQIYKKSGGDTEYDVTDTLFNGVHNNFGAGKTYEWDASCSSFDEDAWLDACVALTEITDYSSYKLNKAVADLSGNEVEVFLAKYDAIIVKFGTTHDHLDRFAIGGINYAGAININTLQASAKSAGTTIAIIAISVVCLAAIGGYFLFRKKKEN